MDKQLIGSIQMHMKDMLSSFALFVGVACFGTLIMSIVFWTDETETSWICVGTLIALVVMIFFAVLNFLSYHQEFMLALSMVGAALLTAYKNAGGDIELSKALSEMHARGKQVPGGACGFWGACGAGISTGIFLSIVNKSSPLNKDVVALFLQIHVNLHRIRIEHV